MAYTIIETTDAITGEIKEHIIFDLGNDEFISMPKVNWDALNANND